MRWDLMLLYQHHHEPTFRTHFKILSNDNFQVAFSMWCKSVISTRNLNYAKWHVSLFTNNVLISGT